MAKRMLVDATHPEETRVAIVESYRDGNRLEDLDFGLASKPVLRGNIYLAKVMRVEAALQAAFVEYGGNRHGFLPFSEIHPDYFRIPMADRPEGAEEHPAHDVPADGEGEAHASSGHEDEIPDPYEHDEPLVPVESAPEGEGGAADLAAGEPTSAAAMGLGAFVASGSDVGLITDFGQAAVPPAEGGVEESVAGAIIVESVGGEVAERVARPGRPRYKIQEVLKRGQVMLIQVVKEERGNKGAALTTFLSLAGRYCVLMPNTDHGGGVSRKITSHQDRRRMKEILDQLEIPEGMAVILRTAGMEQAPPEIQRDLEYLLRLWDNIREQTLQSTAPALIYEEANLIKRSVRDLFTRDISEILVAGAEGYGLAHDFIAGMMPDQVDKLHRYEDPIPLFFRYQVESQIDSLHNPTVQLRSGGYIVINPTEALVAIDVNSGRATRERHIEETAFKTNLEAAEEIARQLRLRDLAGLIVIDFIDMEDGRNNAAVERRLKESMKNDRARLQIGRISPFGLLELSRQRLRPSLLETNFEKCPHCAGTGHVRSVDSAALSILRAIEEEGLRQRAAELVLHVPTKIALYILNQKRAMLSAIEQRYELHVLLHSDDTLVPPDYRLERSRSRGVAALGRREGPAVNADQVLAASRGETESASEPVGEVGGEDMAGNVGVAESRPFESREREPRYSTRGGGGGRRERYGNRPPREERNNRTAPQQGAPRAGGEENAGDAAGNADPAASFGNREGGNGGQGLDDAQRRRRRGRRGGRRRNGGEGRPEGGFRERSPRFAMESGASAPAGPGEAPGNWSAPAPAIPTSVFDLDTTPRPVESPRAPVAPPPMAPQQAARPAAATQAPPAPSAPAREPFVSAHEVVNPPTDAVKGGWWRRLTGQ